jgi:hypothetical protein
LLQCGFVQLVIGLLKIDFQLTQCKLIRQHVKAESGNMWSRLRTATRFWQIASVMHTVNRSTHISRSSFSCLSSSDCRWRESNEIRIHNF